MNQKQYWNDVADTKKFTTALDIDLFGKMLPKTAKILDIGCGYGRILNELYENGYTDLHGIDFSEKMIERAKAENANITYNVTQAAKTSYPDCSFDAIIIFSVLTCIVDDNAQRELISEAFRLLKNGGVLFLNDFLLNSDERNLERYAAFKDKYGVYGAFELPEGAVLRHHDTEYMLNLISKFECVKFDKIEKTTMNGNISKAFNFIGRK